MNTPHVPALFFALFHPSHPAQGSESSLLRRLSSRDFILDLLLQMEAQLLIQISFHLRPTKSDRNLSGVVYSRRQGMPPYASFCRAIHERLFERVPSVTEIIAERRLLCKVSLIPQLDESFTRLAMPAKDR